MANAPAQKSDTGQGAASAAKNSEGDQQATVGSGAVGTITSPEGVIMLSIAVFFDLVGFIPLINIISSIMGGMIIGLWMLIAKKNTLKSYLISLILTLIPVVSDIAPFVGLFSGGKLPSCWTACVYKTLMEG